MTARSTLRFHPPSLRPATLVIAEGARESSVELITGWRTDFLVAFLLASTLLLSFNQADPDLWGHVRYGQDVLSDGGLPATATHTFTAENYPWINHENLSELIFAVMVRSGAPGLMIMKCLLGLVIVALMIENARRHGCSPLSGYGVVLLSTINIAAWWHIRPHIFSLAFFAVLVWLLDRGTEGQTQRLRTGRSLAHLRPSVLWIIPLLFLVWTNTHGGFVAGMCVLVLYLGCRTVESLWCSGAAGIVHLTQYTAVVTASLLATLLNPYGWNLHIWLLHDLVPRRPEIDEWAGLTLSDNLLLPFVLLLLVCAVTWFASRRGRDVTQLLLLAVTAVQGFAHVRHIPFFAILAGYWLAPQCDDVLRRASQRHPVHREMRANASSAARALPALWCGVAVLAVLLAAQLRAVWVDKSKYPVSAIGYMAERDLSGKLVVFFDWAQYAIAALAPPSRVAYDGRCRTCYPQEVADMHFDFIAGELAGGRWRSPDSPPVDGTRVLQHGGPDLVLFSRRLKHAVEIMQQQSDWVLLYQDGLAQLWGRRTKYDDPESADYLPPHARRISEEVQSGFASWPALPEKRRNG